MAQNGDFITECEKLMDKWCKQIEKVIEIEKFYCKIKSFLFQILAESEQIRREADDVGRMY